MHNDSRSDAICFLMPLLWTLITPATLHALCQVYPHGSTDALPFVTMGSGSLNAMSVFESGYKEDMTKEEAMELVARAIRAGIYNDLGSGSNVDLCIITKDGKEYLRNYELLTEKTYQRQKPVVFPPGTARTPLDPCLHAKFVCNSACQTSPKFCLSLRSILCITAVVKKFERDIIPLSAVTVIEGDAMDTS